MTALVLEARRPRYPLADDGFEVSYVPDGGAEHRVPLAQASAVPLEQGIPVRRFTSRKGQQHLSGLRWSATTGGHVGFESWLERDHVLHLDFDPSVIGIASSRSGCTGPMLQASRSRMRRTSSPAGRMARRWCSTAGRPSGARRGMWPSSTRRRGRAHWLGGSTGWSVLLMRSPARKAAAGA